MESDTKANVEGDASAKAVASANGNAGAVAETAANGAPNGAGGWRDFARVNSGRSFIFLGLGAVIGLSLAGYALFTARGTSTLFVPPEDVALVNQQPVSRVDYLALLQALFGVDLAHATPEQRRKVLDDMIREELFVQRGKELDVAATDPEVRGAMVNAVELEIAADAITSQPNEANLRAYFAGHRERFASEGTMTVHDYIVPAGATAAAAALAEALRQGIPSSSLLAQFNARTSSVVGDEQFYFAAKIHLGDPLFAVARALADGAVSAPQPMPDGIHVLLMTKNLKPKLMEFSAAQDLVLTAYRKDAIGKLDTGDEKFLRQRANVLIADDMR